MRRVFICFLLCLLPLQWSWAMVHDALHLGDAHAAQFVHSHEAQDAEHGHSGQSGHEAVDEGDSCDACATYCAHSHLVGLACDAGGVTFARPAELARVLAQSPPPLGAMPLIERPNWLIAAPFVAARAPA